MPFNLGQNVHVGRLEVSAANFVRSFFPRIVLLACLVILASGSPAHAQADYESTNPTGWWIYTGQTAAQITSTISKENARIIDIAPDNNAGSLFTVTYVQNSATYAKRWWWYYGITAGELTNYLNANDGRLISLKAYDIGGGSIRFAVAMIANTGADQKAWWYYYGVTPSEIINYLTAHNARLTALQSYPSEGNTYYAVIMIANTGADAKGWWWWYDGSPATISGLISKNNARIIDLTPAGNGNFNAVLESCSGGCPAWWWFYGQSAEGVLTDAQNYGARSFTLEPYACGDSTCFATAMISDTPADVTVCDTSGCISEAKLQTNICDALAGKVVGYDCLVGSLRPMFGGEARTSTDGSLAMTPSLVMDIASVSKTMTATAIVQLLAQNHLSPTTLIWPYIYPDWTLGPNVKSITFKDLLTHTSGFGQLPNGQCGNNNMIDYQGIETDVATGVDASNIGKPDYGNCNFALLRELMPALLGVNLQGYANGQARANQSSPLYISYMNSHVFGPVGVSTVSCTPPPAAVNQILDYPYPADNYAGTNWDDWSLRCGSGGWQISANDIFSVVSSLATNTTLLSSSWKTTMLSQSLGWDSAVRSDCPSPYVCKNGDLNNGGNPLYALWTYAGILNCNVPVVVMVNSPLPAPYQDGDDIIGLVETAYENAKVAGSPRACTF
jgi:CubicO group peptidase (beta-lactamase class C family)